MKNYPDNFYKENNRGNDEKNQKKKFDFNSYKKNTINSLNEIESFLNNFKKITKIIKIKKILK
jgi:hypothetical protein